MRQAVNTTIQEPGHTILEIALVRIDKRFTKEKLRSHLILEVHDSLTTDSPLDEVATVCEIMQEEMEGIQNELPWLNGVPLKVDVEVGKNWDEKEKV